MATEREQKAFDIKKNRKEGVEVISAAKADIVVDKAEIDEMKKFKEALGSLNLAASLTPDRTTNIKYAVTEAGADMQALRAVIADDPSGDSLGSPNASFGDIMTAIDIYHMAETKNSNRLIQIIGKNARFVEDSDKMNRAALEKLYSVCNQNYDVLEEQQRQLVEMNCRTLRLEKNFEATNKSTRWFIAGATLIIVAIQFGLALFGGA